ncbi:hypothetical protein ABIA30_000219 [Mycobacterium sp. MAA66]|uniref:hypothetical protein n=1 Tax=Mycobacterium sp. MAA66 TaxID=3156297 RepID=UPI003518ADDE
MANEDKIGQAVVLSIQDSAIPRVDSSKLIEAYGEEAGKSLAHSVTALVKEAASMPIEWGDMSLAEGVEDIMKRFAQNHPELPADALTEIGRCVGWQLR